MRALGNPHGVGDGKSLFLLSFYFISHRGNPKIVNISRLNDNFLLFVFSKNK